MRGGAGSGSPFDRSRRLTIALAGPVPACEASRSPSAHAPPPFALYFVLVPLVDSSSARLSTNDGSGSEGGREGQVGRCDWNNWGGQDGPRCRTRQRAKEAGNGAVRGRGRQSRLDAVLPRFGRYHEQGNGRRDARRAPPLDGLPRSGRRVEHKRVSAGCARQGAVLVSLYAV